MVSESGSRLSVTRISLTIVDGSLGLELMSKGTVLCMARARHSKHVSADKYHRTETISESCEPACEILSKSE